MTGISVAALYAQVHASQFPMTWIYLFPGAKSGTSILTQT